MANNILYLDLNLRIYLFIDGLIKYKLKKVNNN